MIRRLSCLRPSFLRLYRAMSRSVVEAFCVSNPVLKAILHLLCLPFVLELTRLGVKMEGMIARDGHLKGASEWLVDIASKGIYVHAESKTYRCRDPFYSSATTPAWAMLTPC